MRVASLAAVVVLGSLPSLARADADAKTVRTFKAKCAGCHGADGKGDTEQGRKSGVESMASAAWQGARSDDQIRAGIRDGVKKTSADGKKQEMDGFGSKLSGDEIDALAKYVRALGPAVPAKPAAVEKKPAPAAAEEKKPAAAEEKPAVATAPVDAKVAALGKKLFKAKCASCHGADGKAQTAQGKKHKIRDMTTAEWRAAHPVDKIVELLTAGTKVTVDGKEVAHVGKQSAANAHAIAAHVVALP